MRAQDQAARLGVPSTVYPSDVSTFRVRVAERVTELTTAGGLPAGSPGTIEDRAPCPGGLLTLATDSGSPG